MTTIRRAFIAWQSVCVLAIVAFTATAALGATATWDRNSEPNIAGYKLSYGTQPGVHSVTINVGNVTTYPFNPPPGMRYYVVVQAYDLAGALSAKSAEVMFDLTNRAPTLVQPANQTSFLNASVSLALSASDPDGNPISFSATGLPPGVSINGASGTLSGLALAKGAYLVSVKVFDGSLGNTKTFTWTVVDQASAPIVVDLRPLDTTLDLTHANLSGTNWLSANTWPAYRVGGAILMKFNLSAIPANATITSAALNLFLTGTDGNVADPNYSMSLHQVVGRNPDIASASGMMANGTTAWTANQCCNGGFPMAQGDISAVRSRTTVNRVPGLKGFDATAVARAWLAAPATNYGLLLNADTSKTEGYRYFSSMEDPVAAQRPFLRVTFTVPVSAPGGGSTPVGGTTPAGGASGKSTAPLGESFARVTGDFDGDGVADLSTYQDGEWRIWTSRAGFANMILVSWGGIGDLPVAADYDGDRLTDVGIYQPLTGRWEIWLSKTQQPTVITWGGLTNDEPSTVDADGDGKADPTILRDGLYLSLLSSTNYSTSVSRR